MFRQRYLLAVLALEALGIGTAGCGQHAPATASPPIAKAPISQKTPPPAAKPIPNGEAQETPDKPASPAEKRYTWMEMEERLAELRTKAKDDYRAAQELKDQYDRLAKPAYTQSKDYEQHIERLNQWQTEMPDSPTPLVVLGTAYVLYAWEARGDGVASTVPEDGAHRFIERIDRAHQLLELAIEKGAADAQPYQSLLTVARAKGLPLEQACSFREAGRALSPIYYSLDLQMAEYLRPEWHGEPGDLEAFANQVVIDSPDDNGFDSFGRIVANMNCYDWGRVFRGDYKRENLVGAARVFLERYPDKPLIVNYAGLFAWAARDMELARTARQRITDKPDPSVFAGDYRAYSFDLWCKASSIPTGQIAQLWASISVPHGLTLADDPRYIWCASSNSHFPIHLLDTQTGAAVKKLYAPGVGVLNLQFDAAGKTVVAPISSRGMNGVVLWNIDEPFIPRLVRADRECHNAAISSDGSLLAYADGTNVKLLAIHEETAEPRVLKCGSSALIEGIAFSNDAMQVAGYTAERLVVWDVETGKELKSTTHDCHIRGEMYLSGQPFFFDREGRLTYMKAEKNAAARLLRFDQQLGGEETLCDQGLNMTCGVSPDGKLVIDYHQIRNEPFSILIWSVEQKKVIHTLEGHVCHPCTFAITPDNKKLATGSSDGEVKIWDLEAALAP